jgi:carboxymethylenebutenolidase
MCDQDHFEEDRLEYEKRGLVTRREFGVLLGGVGMMMLLPPVANAQAVAEREVTIKTPDGSADGYFVYPAKGSAAGVLFWPDIFGLRPATRQMGKRLAQSGYSVLVVNPFYRQRKSPVAENASSANIKELFPLMQALTETTQMTDARAFIAWLDQQPEVNRNRKIGTQGYCMGGPIAFRTAAAVPDRVGAVAAFHPAALVTEGPNSPHLQAMKSKAQFLVALGDNDDKQRPKEKDILRETFGKAGLTIEVDVYKAAHGWCPPDSQVYNEPEAERAWSRLVARYKEGLA